ncbi:DUF2306 domain-containing protein [Paenibacillus paeoniae]|uniref:DUF2306 domain-containing protein n=1 Tax=Paenibacillus paeoniae TaxID=2292705 RepID=A0A371P7L3_9BACL|nr:DUF2306 domain-containing protein [Paenibacillus paeoniae]REK71912.1 DUF2306 domain-containing protein [Paenibacillus paeoniae]
MTSLYTSILFVHIIAGTICLLAGAIAMGARKRKGVHTLVGETYHAFYLIVFVTSIAMAIMKWSELYYLFFIALFSYGQALYGYLARKRKRDNWLRKHIVGMLGSYIGVITAILVTNGESITRLAGIPTLLLWFIPTLIGTPLIIQTVKRYIPV